MHDNYAMGTRVESLIKRNGFGGFLIRSGIARRRRLPLELSQLLIPCPCTNSMIAHTHPVLLRMVKHHKNAPSFSSVDFGPCHWFHILSARISWKMGAGNHFLFLRLMNSIISTFSFGQRVNVFGQGNRATNEWTTSSRSDHPSAPQPEGH